MTLTLGGPLVLVGAGKMGGALLTGWIERGLEPASVYIQDPQPSDDISALAKRTGIKVIGSPEQVPQGPAVIVLAVKPQIMDDVLPGLKSCIEQQTVILSVAAGKTIEYFQKSLGPDTAIVRSIPNTPAAIGRGITVACANANVSPAQKDACDALLRAAGMVAWSDDEATIDPVTAVSGSGPAYVFLLAECLEEAGIKAGLDQELACKLARETVSGAGELLRRSELPASELRKNVTSPGGTTAAALEILMGEGGLQQLMTRAVKAAAERSRELSS
ncbi:MAG: pyrroline-5-carboxylate reductase [Alphaproteobacteria bacterium]